MNESGLSRSRAMWKLMTTFVARAGVMISASADISSSLLSGLDRILKRRMTIAFSSGLRFVVREPATARRFKKLAFNSPELPAVLSDVDVGEVGASVCDRLRAELAAHISDSLLRARRR